MSTCTSEKHNPRPQQQAGGIPHSCRECRRADLSLVGAWVLLQQRCADVSAQVRRGHFSLLSQSYSNTGFQSNAFPCLLHYMC